MDNTCDFFEKLKTEFELPKVEINSYSPLTLAYIGDSVYDLVIRSYVVGLGNVPNKKLHKKAVEYVSAVAQAEILEKIKPSLSEEELSVYKRGKNSKPASKAKNATQKEYLKATGFEALIGYLYLLGRTDRIIELVKLGTDIVPTDK